MIAVVNIDGRQLKVEKNQEFYVNRLSGEKGDKITLNEVLIIEKDNKTTLGTPTINGANVTISILDHIKDKKIVVFKKKRRKGYKVKNGHRQMLTKIKIESISTNSKNQKSNTKADEKKTTAKKTTAKKTTAKKTTAKKTTAKKTTAKKT
ncbi:MAG: 50S ribosomal protein L21, partial [Flavobacteriales bacterium TMED191]